MKKLLSKVDVSVNVLKALDKMSHEDAEEMYKAFKTMCRLSNKYGEDAVSISTQHAYGSCINKEMDK